jgi:cytochrome c-type biogenesis protein
LVVGIFSYSLTAAEAIDKLLVFFWFGIGFGIPLLLLSLLSGATQRWIVTTFSRHSRLVNIFGGVLLIGVGFYDLFSNWSLIKTYLVLWFS